MSSPPSTAAILDSAQPGLGSPFTLEVWSEITKLHGLDPALDEQLKQAEYAFTPVSGLTASDPLVLVYQRLEPLLLPAPKVVFTFSWLKRGGAEWVGIQLVREAQRRYGPDSVLVLVLDWDVDEARDWLPEQTRLCMLMREAPELSREQRTSFLIHYLAAVRPSLVMNCNSGIAWDVMRDHAAELSERMRLAAFAFCFDYAESGEVIGYPASHLPQALPHLALVVSDNTGFRDELRRVFGLPASWLAKVVAVAQPVELPPPPSFVPQGRAGRRPLVAWASRICRQKRPEFVINLSLIRPQVDFVVYGDLYEPERYVVQRFEGDNIRYAGSFRTLRDLPVETFDAFLYTALYDGLPNIVLAAGALGLPVVSAMVGGIGEVIDEETGWPVDDHGDVAAYAAALDGALTNPTEAARRARRLYDRIAETHSEAAYQARIRDISIFAADRL